MTTTTATTATTLTADDRRIMRLCTALVEGHWTEDEYRLATAILAAATLRGAMTKFEKHLLFNWECETEDRKLLTKPALTRVLEGEGTVRVSDNGMTWDDLWAI